MTLDPRPDPLSVREAVALEDVLVGKIAQIADQLGWTDADHARLDLDRLHIEGYVAGLRLLEGLLPDVYPETMYETRLILSLGLLRIARLYL